MAPAIERAKGEPEAMGFSTNLFWRCRAYGARWRRRNGERGGERVGMGEGVSFQEGEGERGVEEG